MLSHAHTYLTPLAPPRLFGGHFDDFACQADGCMLDIGVMAPSCGANTARRPTSVHGTILISVIITTMNHTNNEVVSLCRCALDVVRHEP